MIALALSRSPCPGGCSSRPALTKQEFRILGSLGPLRARQVRAKSRDDFVERWRRADSIDAPRTTSGRSKLARSTRRHDGDRRTRSPARSSTFDGTADAGRARDVRAAVGRGWTRSSDSASWASAASLPSRIARARRARASRSVPMRLGSAGRRTRRELDSEQLRCRARREWPTRQPARGSPARDELRSGVGN